MKTNCKNKITNYATGKRANQVIKLCNGGHVPPEENKSQLRKEGEDFPVAIMKCQLSFEMESSNQFFVLFKSLVNFFVLYC